MGTIQMVGLGLLALLLAIMGLVMWEQHSKITTLNAQLATAATQITAANDATKQAQGIADANARALADKTAEEQQIESTLEQKAAQDQTRATDVSTVQTEINNDKDSIGKLADAARGVFAAQHPAANTGKRAVHG